MQRVILLAVIKLLLEAMTDLDRVVGRDSQVAPVKQSMQVLPKQETVARTMGSTISVGANVRGIQHVQDVRIRQRALPLVNIGHDNPESPLSQSRQHGLRLTIPEAVSHQIDLYGWHSTRL